MEGETVTLSSEMETSDGKQGNVIENEEVTRDGKQNRIEGTNGKVEEPMRDMEFDGVAEMIVYYKEYGKQKGFGVSKRTQSKTDGVVTYVTIGCHRAGKPKQSSKNFLKPHPVSKTNCKARICAKLCEDMKWRVGTVETNHNHPCNPSKFQRLRRNRALKPHESRHLDLNESAGIRNKQNNNDIGVEAGRNGDLTFLEKDAHNHFANRRLRLGEGDAVALLSYFKRVQKIDKEFYYSIDFDEENRIRNLFWADARSRAAYEEFGDVINFDTACLTKKYDMPFVAFVGVNHHGQLTLLGCGLIASEDTQTFVWLFETWLTCMSGNAPSAIITNQDRAMKNAIEVVFPKARHRWCLWHIMKKIPEKLRGHEQYESVKFLLQHVVYESLFITDFEAGWNGMVVKYNLKTNDWLEELYTERHRWVPCFVKDYFWAGMSTIKQSESVNTFFDGHVNAKTSLKQFVEQYDDALMSKVEEEKDADFKSFNSHVPTITQYPMEKQLQAVYTISKFGEFQEQLAGLMYCSPELLESHGETSYYEISEVIFYGEKKESSRRVLFKVCLTRGEEDKEFEVKCNCRWFEFLGILCRHTLIVLIMNDLYSSIPTKYILRRWRKDITRHHTKTRVTYSDWRDTEPGRRYDMMCKIFYDVADMAYEFEDKCKTVIDRLLDIRNVLLMSDGVCGSRQPTSNLDLRDSSRVESVASQDIMSPTERCIGCPPSKRKKTTTNQIVTNRGTRKKASINSEHDQAGKDDIILIGEHGNLIETQESMPHQAINSNAARWVTGISHGELWVNISGDHP